MKKKFLLLAKSLLLLLVLGFFAVIIRDSSDMQVPLLYDASLPTPKKYEMLKKWIPPDSDIIVVADIFRLKAIPRLNEFLEEIFSKEANTWFLQSILRPSNAIGMIALYADLNDASPSITAIFQSEFDQPSFLNLIQQELIKEHVKLMSENMGGTLIYWINEERPQLAITFPDHNHLLVGNKGLLEKTIQNEKDRQNTLREFPNQNSSLFGIIRFQNKLGGLLPAQLANISSAQFASNDEGELRVGVNCKDSMQAKNLMIFLSGMKALYAIQNENNAALLKALDKINFNRKSDSVWINIPLEKLPDILLRNQIK